MHVVARIVFSLIPILYVWFIWLQSSHFSPGKLGDFLYEKSRLLFLVIGGGLEMAHLFEFGLLCLFIVISFLAYGPLTRWQLYFAITVSLAYGIIDEIHQSYIPYRSASFGDILKDFIGVIVFSYIIHRYYFGKGASKAGNLLRKVTKISSKKNTDISY